MSFTLKAPGGPRNRLKFTEPGLTEQQHAESCDIHNILKKYENLGMDPHVYPDPSRFVDVSDSVDYHTAANMVADAKSMFEELPSKLREQFDNDPITMMDFMAKNPSQEDLIALGMIQAPIDPLPGDSLNPPKTTEEQKELPLEE